MNGQTPNSGGWKKSLTALLTQKNGIRSDHAKASIDTQRKRSHVLMRGFTQLRAMGYRLDDVHAFKGRHMSALVSAWVEQGLSASVIQNRISIFRIFAGWIGKTGMVQASSHYVDDPARVTRSSIARTDKSWSAKGIDPKSIIHAIWQEEPWIAMALSVQCALGLRMRESLMLKPWLADLGTVLDVTRGTKGGRHRTIPITHQGQRQILDQVKRYVQDKNAFIAPAHLSLLQARNRYYTVLTKAGVTRRHGITSHGLRHEYANDYFAALAGYESPVRGGPIPEDRAIEHYARMETAEALGHSRESITTHYLGRAKKSRDGEPGIDLAPDGQLAFDPTHPTAST
jgi:site-specific recombinase XerC